MGKSILQEIKELNKKYLKNNNLVKKEFYENIERCPNPDCMLYAHNRYDGFYECKNCGIIDKPLISREKRETLVKK